MKRALPRPVVMNGTERPRGLWRIAGVGPCEWILSHRWFFRMMGCDYFASIYTPKPNPKRRGAVPGLDQLHPYRRDDGVPF
ncbi:hypothetical protein AB4099_18800 [Bosea sp. 2KB_26]|uniref:hypothetical protein n=1 Tax=Bosea sp. 2KB_26 TaxID=3237475 RepID=UPI003F9266A2